VLHQIETKELILLRQDFVRDLLHRRHKVEPEMLLPLAERAAQVAARFMEERDAMQAMVRDWTAEARRQGWVVSDSVHIKVPPGMKRKEARQAVKDYASDLGYLSVQALVEARIMQPAIEWARRRNAMLEEFKDGLRDVSDA
jgi:hypothetical protein